MASKVNLKKCPMEECWEQIPEHKHLCNACTSWWYRVCMKTPQELVGYMRRMGRFSGRLDHLRTKKRRVA